MDEKYISIEYSVWNAKYKGMEQRLKEVERELEAEKRRNTFELVVTRRNFNSLPKTNMERTYVLGHLSFELKGIPLLRTEDRERLQQDIQNEYRTVTSYHGHTERLVTYEDLSRVEEKLKEEALAIQKTHMANLEETEKIKRLPRIIRWLFNIKVN